MTINLTQDLQKNIFQHVEGTFPNEGGGFLLGEVNGDDVLISDAIHIDNVFETEEQYHRYAMTPQNWAQMEDEADARGLTLVGYHHSHPNAPAIPSEYDREHALPNFAYVITSVRQGKAVDQKVWHLRRDRSVFDEGELVVKK
jgi:proteasome lid subunit RPN8/RPN11